MAWSRLLALTSLRPGCYDVDERVADMNINGIAACSISPALLGSTAACSSHAEDKWDKRLPICKAYNDWHVDERCGVLIPPLHSLVPASGLGHGRDRGRNLRLADKGCHAVSTNDKSHRARPAQHP